MPPWTRPFVSALAAVALLGLLPGGAAAQSGRLTFLHINDVYEIAPVDGKGGFAQLMTLLRWERARNPEAITTVGGDFLSPSLLSRLTEGAQMIDLFNAVGVDIASFGNHEFDFGPDVPVRRIAESRFPWIGTNVLGLDGKPYGGAVATLTRQVGAITVGFFSVLTPETKTHSSPGPTVAFTDPFEAATRAVRQLKAEGAHVVVALTHLDMAEDRELARKVRGIDVILGGHDHDPTSLYDNGVLILKAGYDAHYLGVVDLDVTTRPSDKGPVTTVTPRHWQFQFTGSAAPDPEIATVVERYTARLDGELGVVIGRTAVDLDSRGGTVRTRESAMGSLMADALRETLKADVALVNGGGLRGNAVHAAGSPLTRKDILAETPFGNVAVLLEVSGADLLAVLENGFSKVEDAGGRFPQVSGLTVAYDPAAEPGRRVRQVTVGGQPLDPNAAYRLATSDYLAGGGDGYALLKQARMLVDSSAAVLVATMVMEYVQAKGTVAPAGERIRTLP